MIRGKIALVASLGLYLYQQVVIANFDFRLHSGLSNVTSLQITHCIFVGPGLLLTHPDAHSAGLQDD